MTASPYRHASYAIAVEQLKQLMLYADQNRQVENKVSGRGLQDCWYRTKMRKAERSKQTDRVRYATACTLRTQSKQTRSFARSRRCWSC